MRDPWERCWPSLSVTQERKVWGEKTDTNYSETEKQEKDLEIPPKKWYDYGKHQETKTKL